MSRPFSYNDENFTVVGNVLFCHIKLSSQVQIGEHIVEVPPAIYNRLLCTTANMTRERFVLNDYASYAISTTITQDNGKYYLIANGVVNGKLYNYLNGIYYLKDI